MAQNPLYNVLAGNTSVNGINGLWGQIEAFKRNFKGDPKAQIQQMLNSGQISQAQYNQAVQMANNLMQLMPGAQRR